MRRTVILLAMLALAGPASGQEIVAELKGEDGQGFNAPGWPIARWNGYWVTRDEGNATKLYLFHENGEFAQLVGREGQGPMEWAGITDAVVMGDSLYVHDALNARVTVIGPDLGYVRDFKLIARPLELDAVGDRLVFAGIFYERDKAGRAAFFKQASSDAPITDGFDKFDIIPALGSTEGWRKIAVHGDEITTMTIDGLLRTFDGTGRLVHEVVAERPDGWTRSLQEYRDDREGSFASYAMDVSPARDGLVWVAFAVPSDDYRDHVTSVEVRSGKTLHQLHANGRRSQVSLIDPATGNALHSVRFPGFVSTIVGPYVASARTDDVGRVTITIRQLPEIRRDAPRR